MNLERLHILYDHLMWGKLGHKVFDFETINDGGINKCGTAGCAMGEFPIIWDEWKFTNSGEVSFNSSEESELLIPNVSTWLDISKDATRHLFVSDYQRTHEFGGKDLDVDATRKQVASNIKAFINKCY